jgi:molybdopterin-synthase adenylyltransferase
MAGTFHHETLYRGQNVLAKLSSLRVTICGAGAVGSNLADNLVRQGVAKLRVIDHDRVEQHNISTQIYGEPEIGVWKVEALRNHLFRVRGVEIDGIRKQLEEKSARRLLKDSELVVDALDNSTGRQCIQRFVRSAGIPCVHVGLHADYCEIVWDEQYRVPQVAADAEEVCDYPLARNLVLLAVTAASEAVVQWVADGKRLNLTGTLRDLAVRPLGARE